VSAKGIALLAGIQHLRLSVMKSVPRLLFRSPIPCLLPLLAGTASLHAATAKVEIGTSREDNSFATKTTAPPATNDAAAGATFKVIAGSPDPNGGSLAVLNDGKIPSNDDEPEANFFFAGDGRILVDLGKTIDVASLASYSWHSGSRAGQYYEVFAADGSANDFKAEPGADDELTKCGWTLLAKVDTTGKRPGQHAAAITPTSGKALGNYRYLLFDIKKNPKESQFNATFFSEIDIVDAAGPDLNRIEKPKRITQEFASKDGKFKYTLDVTEAPDLQEWCAKNLIPTLDEWYPKIIEMLPVDGVTPAHNITFTLKNATDLPGHLQGVPAYASGNSVVFNSKFMRDQASGEAVGAGIHEVVHVVQFGGDQGDRPRRRGGRPPTWVTEGVADYIRWFLYEPEKKGAEITKGNVQRATYDGSYRITANFFDWVIKTYEKDLMRKLNVATHDGYSDELWKTWTGKTVQELGAEWKSPNNPPFP
jgi:hypothetical protein